MLLRLSLVLLLAAPTFAAWPDDPTVNVPLSLAVGDKSDVFCVSDGEDGAIVAWEDTRGGDRDIYVQRVNAQGAVLWQADGVAVCTAPGDQGLYHSSTGTTGFTPLVADGAGGAWIVWQDERAFGARLRDVYAQRINAAGEVLLADGGVPVATGAGMEDQPTACPDGAGGVIVVWQDKNTDPVFYDLHGQRLSGAGEPLWNGGQPLPLVVMGWDQDGPTLCPDGHGGAYLAWSDGRDDVGDVYAQHLDPEGASLWTANGVAVCVRPDGQDAVTARLADDGDLLLAWVDRRGAGPDIYAQKLAADDGTGRWTAGGFAACSAGESQYRPALCGDTAGGAIVCWFDYRNASGPPWNLDIYAQRIGADGAAAWPVNGVLVCGAPDAQRDADLTPDGAGGAFIAWEDNREGTGHEDVYAQRLDAAGTALWAADGVPVSTAPKNQKRPDLVAGAGGVLIVWPDDRELLYAADIYCDRVAVDDPTVAPPVRPGAALQLEVRGDPAAGRSVVAFALPGAATVTVEVCDLRGRRLAVLSAGAALAAGWHELGWDRRDGAGRALPSGVYLVRLRAGAAVATARAVVVR
jgi:hypothetical protein